VTKILNFLSEHNVGCATLPYHQAGGNLMLELKQLGASIPAPSLSSASSPSLALSPLIVICLPHQKDALLSHFTEVAEALSPPTTFSLRQNNLVCPTHMVLQGL